MILQKKTSLTLTEVSTLVKDLEEKKDLITYLKTFNKLTKEEAEKIKKEILSLNNAKIKEENIIKIIDILPKDIEDVNKIFTDVNLTEEEANSILEFTKKY